MFPQVAVLLASGGSDSRCRLDLVAGIMSRVGSPVTRSSFQMALPNCIGKFLDAIIPILVIVDSSFFPDLAKEEVECRALGEPVGVSMSMMRR